CGGSHMKRCRGIPWKEARGGARLGNGGLEIGRPHERLVSPVFFLAPPRSFFVRNAGWLVALHMDLRSLFFCLVVWGGGKTVRLFDINAGRPSGDVLVRGGSIVG